MFEKQKIIYGPIKGPKIDLINGYFRFFMVLLTFLSILIETECVDVAPLSYHEYEPRMMEGGNNLVILDRKSNIYQRHRSG